MHVLHINCNYIGTALHQLMVEKLDKLGYKNSVFAPTYNKKTAVIIPNENVLVSECFKKWDRLFFDYKQKKIFKSLEKNYNMYDFDIIHAYTLFTDGNCARMMSEKYNIPYVVAVRSTDVNSFFRWMPHLRMRGVKTMLKASAVFFLSEEYRRQVFEKYVPKKYRDVLMKKTKIIPNGIDDFWFENAPLQENKIENTVKLVYAGRINRNKNTLTTLKAMRILIERGYNVSFTVVGKIENKRIYNKIKSTPNTKCLSAQPKENLLKIYRDNNIFVMPSFTETFGLVYAEAMSQGLPVIYSKGQGFDTQFPDGKIGYSVSAYDARDVADGIEKTIKNHSRIVPDTIPSARVFNWAEITSEYDRIYKTIILKSGE